MKFIKKSFKIVGFLAFVWFLLVQFSGCFTFRTADKVLQKQFTRKNIEPPDFYNYTVENRNMHYAHIGDTTKPLIVFIHGSPGSLDNFANFLADTSLLQQAQMFAIDRPGFGYSGFGVAESSFKEQAKLIAPAIERFHNAKTILVGHSLGGPLIVRLAMDYPQLVSDLVIVAGSVAPNLEPREWWRPFIDNIPLRWFVPPSLAASNREIRYAYRELNTMLPLWPTVTQRTTILQGSADFLVPAENAQFAQQQLTNACKVNMQILPNENHFLVWQNPNIIKNALIWHLKETD